MREERVSDFCLVVSGDLSVPVTGEELMDATEMLGGLGCTDASVGAHADGLELIFHRRGRSLEGALQSAVSDVESAGFRVVRVEMQRQAIAAVC